MNYYVYITTNPERTTLYTGMTNELSRRIVEHYLNRGDNKTYTGKYYCYCLIFYDAFVTANEAISSKKYIKGKSRKWKEDLISESNPDWRFLNEKIVGEWPPKKILEDSYFQNYIQMKSKSHSE